MPAYTFIGPITQLLSMSGLPSRGPLSDADLPVIENCGLLLRDKQVMEIGDYSDIRKKAGKLQANHIELEEPSVVVPGWIDAHTHICFAGSRARDYALRNSGATYQEIAKRGGGIWDTVQKTREADLSALAKGVIQRALAHLQNGITTIEVKSGYGLTVLEELKMLRAIRQANQQIQADLIPTCLAAHITPRDFQAGPTEYLKLIASELLPKVREEGLANRVDAFIEEGAFDPDTIRPYLKKAKEMGFQLTLHADQFSTGGSEVAIEFGALSADHLEASTDREIDLLSKSSVIAMALPGASLGLGCGFAPARKILDAGGTVAIASDHNPGSAPMGDLLTQACILGAFEKLSNAEVLAGITYRAAAALDLKDRGILQPGYLADFSIFYTGHYSEILYNQGSLKPKRVWKNGQEVFPVENKK
ncbi:imidazolonepropionase [Lentiprolixibacter aurantiacus]|uniref:Imidazolonepropionase n=1 Tax=Lentiprolixibacter aurantiacus TaxID=2993939 RepID=A0AAE3MJV1_9FLAO|nr:imidazolonepropionase [Lentiprolixibacter aurantiacus]MCX2718961.1 imidazolonepropionase [Lentiprolixibacter aurantiacus]